MNILALDLATQSGWAKRTLDGVECGSESFKRIHGLKRTPDEHIGSTFMQFNGWIYSHLKWEGITLVIYEEPMGNFKNASARNIIVGLRGVLLYECAVFGVTVKGIPQTKLKKLATGKGNAKKHEMIAAAKAAYPELEVIDDNAADALLLLKYGVNL